MTTVKGTLNVDEAVTFDSTLEVTGLITASAGVSVPSGLSFSSDTVDIDGGTIDGTPIGNNSPADGSFTQVTVDNVVVNGSNIGHTDDTDLITVAANNMTVAGDVTISDSSKTLNLTKTSITFGSSASPAMSGTCNGTRGQLTLYYDGSIETGNYSIPYTCNNSSVEAGDVITMGVSSDTRLSATVYNIQNGSFQFVLEAEGDTWNGSNTAAVVQFIVFK